MRENMDSITMPEPMSTTIGNMQVIVHSADNVLILSPDEGTKINGVVYKVVSHLAKVDGAWGPEKSAGVHWLSIDRLDKKEAVFPWKARDKAEAAILAAVILYLSDNKEAETLGLARDINNELFNLHNERENVVSRLNDIDNRIMELLKIEKTLPPVSTPAV